MSRDSIDSPVSLIDDDEPPAQTEPTEDEESRDMTGPTRSVYNVIYVPDDDDLMSEDPSEYLEEIDLPLPVITDSESSRWSRFGQCCDWCDTCLRKNAWIMSCDCIWVKVAFYYFILNVLVLGMFAMTMYMPVLAYDKNPVRPQYQQLLFKKHHHPGVSLVPSMVNIHTAPTAIVWYGHHGKDKDTNRRKDAYVKALDELKYLSQSCEWSHGCRNNPSLWGPCETSDYGYSDDKPCFFLKLNKLTMWIPEEYREKSNIPDDVPSDLLSVIDVQSANIWVHCAGETPYDRDKIGKISYFPGPYFNSSFFPLSAMKGSNPIITIKLEKYKRGYLAKLVCGLYAGNVHTPKAHYTYIYIKEK